MAAVRCRVAALKKTEVLAFWSAMSIVARFASSDRANARRCPPSSVIATLMFRPAVSPWVRAASVRRRACSSVRTGFFRWGVGDS
jgi:hypothetical protein